MDVGDGSVVHRDREIRSVANRFQAVGQAGGVTAQLKETNTQLVMRQRVARIEGEGPSIPIDGLGRLIASEKSVPQEHEHLRVRSLLPSGAPESSVYADSS